MPACCTRKCDCLQEPLVEKWSHDVLAILRGKGIREIRATAVSTGPPRGNLVDGLPRAFTYLLFFLIRSEVGGVIQERSG